jgi:hypothetical protein
MCTIMNLNAHTLTSVYIPIYTHIERHVLCSGLGSWRKKEGHIVFILRGRRDTWYVCVFCTF